MRSKRIGPHIFALLATVGVLALLAISAFLMTAGSFQSLAGMWMAGAGLTQQWKSGPHDVYAPGTIENSDPQVESEIRPKINDFYSSQKNKTLALAFFLMLGFNYFAFIGLRLFGNWWVDPQEDGISPVALYLFSFLAGAFFWVGFLRILSLCIPLGLAVWATAFLGLAALFWPGPDKKWKKGTGLRARHFFMANFVAAFFFIFNLQCQWFPCGGDSTAWWVPQILRVIDQPFARLPKIAEAYFEHCLALPFYLVEIRLFSNPLFLMPYAWINGCVKAAGLVGLIWLARRLGLGSFGAFLAGVFPFVASLRLDLLSHTYLFGSSNPLALNLHAQIILAVLLPIWGAGIFLMDAGGGEPREGPLWPQLASLGLAGIGISSLSPNGPLYVLGILGLGLLLRQRITVSPEPCFIRLVKAVAPLVFLGSFLLAARLCPPFTAAQGATFLVGGLFLAGTFGLGMAGSYQWARPRDLGQRKSLAMVALVLGILVGLIFLGNVPSLFFHSGSPPLHRGLVEAHGSMPWRWAMLWEPICARSEDGRILEGQLPLFVNYGLSALLVGAAGLSCLPMSAVVGAGQPWVQRASVLLVGVMAFFLLSAYFHYFRIFSPWLGGMGVRNRFFEVPFYAGIFFGMVVLGRTLPGLCRSIFWAGTVIAVALPFFWNFLPDGNWIIKQWLINAGFWLSTLGIFHR